MKLHVLLSLIEQLLYLLARNLLETKNFLLNYLHNQINRR